LARATSRPGLEHGKPEVTLTGMVFGKATFEPE
jgi:hypothetical protein